MKKAAFDLAVRSVVAGLYVPQTVIGYVVGNFGIHCAEGLWRITHLRSGLVVGGFYGSRTAAHISARTYEGMAMDWDSPKWKFGKRPARRSKLGRQIEAINAAQRRR